MRMKVLVQLAILFVWASLLDWQDELFSVLVQSNNLRGDKKNNKRHFFERLSITLQRENGSMLLERCPLLAADVDGDF